MHKKTLRLGASLLAVVAVLGAACGGDDSTPSATEAPTTDAPGPDSTIESTEAPTTDAPGPDSTIESTEAPSGDPFKLGVVTSMTGNYQFIGGPTEAGVQAAVEVLNSQGGVGGRPVEYVLCDDETNPEKGRTCYERLVRNENVDVLIGFPLGAVTEAVAPLIDEDQIPTWILGGAYGGRSLAGQKYMFSGLPVTEDVLDAVFAWAASQGHDQAWILTTDDITGEPCREFASKDDATRHGIEVIGTNTMQASAQTAAPQVAQISADADFTFICVSGGAGVVAAVAYEESGLSAPAVAVHSQAVDFIANAMTGRVSNDTLYVASFCTLGVITDDLGDEYKCAASAREFVETLAAVAPNTPPDVLAAHAYDGAILLAQAAAATDGSADAIVEYMTSLTEAPAAMGVYTFTDEVRRGLGPDQVLLGLFEDGKWVMSDPLQLPRS